MGETVTLLKNAASTEEKETEWLISGYIPRNSITILAGEGGTGKTSILCDLMAAVTTGRWPFFFQGRDFLEGMKPEKVLFFSAEDSWSHVLIGRLKRSGADLELIKYLDPEDPKFVELDFNSELLKQFIDQERPGLVLFDPVQSFIPPNLRMGERNAMRKCLTPLMGYGEKYKTTFVIVAHTNKQSNVWGRKRIADSSVIWDIARSVLMLGETPEAGVRYLTQEKSNYGRLQQTALYTLEDGVPVFKSYTNKKDRDYIIADSRDRQCAPARNEAKEFILNALSDEKQMEVSALNELARSAGISENSLKNAKSELNKEGLIHMWSVGFKPKKFLVSLTATN